MRDGETGIGRLIEARLSRRQVLAGSLAAFAVAGGTTAVARSPFPFAPVPANTRDTIALPPGYRWHVVARWGDPLWSDAPGFDAESRGTGASQARAFGDNNDGMALFTRDDRIVLCVNHEYMNNAVAFANRASRRPETADDIAKSKAASGVSVLEIAEAAGRWGIVVDSPVNRRLTADTPIEITGPGRGHALLQTAADPGARLALGTWANCGCGQTPWGTYLTCEENFNLYFSAGDTAFRASPEQHRYGLGAKDRGGNWVATDPRFDMSRHPNEANRAGWVVEIDPLTPGSRPRKLTALGRFKHENAELTLAADGRVVVYMGDDERGEYLYRYVSANRYRPGGGRGDLLENGQLSVARFHDDGSGKWVALTPAATGMGSEAEIRVHARLAASAVGATTMDRPEWVAAHPDRAEVYCCLTNNKHRGRKTNAGGDAMPVGGPNPRPANRYGQIVRWRPRDGDHGAARFGWDLFVLAGNPVVHRDARRGSANVTADNMFNAPDGIGFDPAGRLWIRTDGKSGRTGHFAGHGNNQMLIADPVTGKIRRFMVGPRGCEVCGLAFAPDGRTAFVCIQHPGARGSGHFPDGGEAPPRSAVIAIQREDGGPIA